MGTFQLTGDLLALLFILRGISTLISLHIRGGENSLHVSSLWFLV